MKTHGIGVGYQFPHDFEGDDVEQQYLPDELSRPALLRSRATRATRSTIAARMARARGARRSKPRKKQRTNPPMASMSDALKPNMENRKKLAETQKKDAG